MWQPHAPRCGAKRNNINNTVSISHKPDWNWSRVFITNSGHTFLNNVSFVQYTYLNTNVNVQTHLSILKYMKERIRMTGFDYSPLHTIGVVCFWRRIDKTDSQNLIDSASFTLQRNLYNAHLILLRFSMQKLEGEARRQYECHLHVHYGKRVFIHITEDTY